MTTDKIKAAEALTPMLSACHLVSGEPLQAVWQIYTEGSLDRLILNFGQVSLIVIADENDDSIDLRVARASDLRVPGGVDGTHLEPWSSFIGNLSVGDGQL